MTGLMLKTLMLYDEFIRTLFRSIWPLLLIHTLLYRCKMFHEYELGYETVLLYITPVTRLLFMMKNVFYEEQDTTTCNNLNLFHMKLCLFNLILVNAGTPK